ncbi:MAG: hypothetical protein R3D26_11595 [Cyanobacteriota/Melainabacteria group bacterium]
MIYFSSHGSPSDIDVGGVNYFVAHDTDPKNLFITGIAMQDLARIIKGRVQAQRIVPASGRLPPAELVAPQF